MSKTYHRVYGPQYRSGRRATWWERVKAAYWRWARRWCGYDE